MTLIIMTAISGAVSFTLSVVKEYVVGVILSGLLFMISVIWLSVRESDLIFEIHILQEEVKALKEGEK